MNNASQCHAGLRSVGVCLPPAIRENDWWPLETVRRWADRAIPIDTEQAQQGGDLDAYARALMEARNDPFGGSVRRHILDADLAASDIEVRACRDALTRANLTPGDVDLLVGSSGVPDYLTVPNVATVHEQLGLRRRCPSLSVDAACNGFAMSLEVARNRITTGQSRCALLFQSSIMSRIMPPDAPYTPWFGDGATAVVVTEGSPQTSIAAIEHGTDGSTYHAMVAGVPGGRWYDEGRVVWHAEQTDLARKMFLDTPAQAAEAVTGALERAGWGREQVAFFACHQPTPWFRSVTQAHLGLDKAAAVDTFADAGNLSSVNIPLVLAKADRAGMLRTGDRVVTFGGGSGVTYASVALQWGADPPTV